MSSALQNKVIPIHSSKISTDRIQRSLPYHCKKMCICASQHIAVFLRKWQQYIYITFEWYLPLYIDIYRMCYNRRTVNASTTPHICHQLGTKHARETLLCWFIVMIWVLVWDDIYIDMKRWTSFWIFLPQSEGSGCPWQVWNDPWKTTDVRLLTGLYCHTRSVSLPPDCATTIHRNPVWAETQQR